MTTLDCRLSSDAVCGLGNISYRQLDYWLRSGILPPPRVPARGCGTHRRFGFLDIVRVRLVAALRRQGVSLQAIRKALDILKAEWRIRDPLTTGHLLALDGRVCLDTDPETLWDLLARQSLARRIVVIDVGELARDTAEKVQAYAIV